jgi:hypothetical protein
MLLIAHGVAVLPAWTCCGPACVTLGLLCYGLSLQLARQAVQAMLLWCPGVAKSEVEEQIPQSTSSY